MKQITRFTYLLVASFMLFSYSSAIAIHVSEPDSSQNLVDKAKIQLKMQTAKHKFYEQDIRGALNLYREIIADFPEHAPALYRIGECHTSLKNFDLALEYLDKATAIQKDVNKESDLLYGKVYHRLGKLDEAIEAFERFKQTIKSEKQLEEYNVVAYINQCKYAKEMMEKPVDVKINNMGRNVNSRYGDYAPSFTTDMKQMIFTSRRPDTKGGGTDVLGDHKYYEDIYYTTWDAENNEWALAEPIQGKINTEFHDASLSISPDGTFIYIYYNIYGATKSGDIYVSKLSSSGKWSKPKPMEKTINSSYWESSASVTADGNTMYFVSERSGGQGSADIYEVKKISKREWGEPVNLGAVVNTPEDENTVYVHPSGKVLFFSSKGHNSMGGYDVFKSEKINGKWSKPVNLGYPINTVDDDLHFVVSTDAKTGYYSAFKSTGLGERDIYTVDLSNYPVLSPDFMNRTEGTLSGTVMDKASGKSVDCMVEVYDVATGSKVGEAKLDANGKYSINLPLNKKYEIKAKPEGYKQASDTVNFKAAERGATEEVRHLVVEKE